MRHPRVMEQPTQTQPRRSFARDVLVNVLANLIAAAVIYLGAVLAGYITADRILVTVAVVLVLFTATQVLIFPSIKNEDAYGKPRPRWARWALLALHLLAFVWSLAFLVNVWR